MVEQRPFKPLVGGSSPPAPTKNSQEIRNFCEAIHQNTFFLPALHTHEPHRYAHGGHSKILGGHGGHSVQKLCEQLFAWRSLVTSVEGTFEVSDLHESHSDTECKHLLVVTEVTISIVESK